MHKQIKSESPAVAHWVRAMANKQKVGCSNPSWGSDSSTAKCSAIGLSVTALWRWPFKTDAPCHSRCGTLKNPQWLWVLSIGQNLQPFTCNGDFSIWVNILEWDDKPQNKQTNQIKSESIFKYGKIWHKNLILIMMLPRCEINLTHTVVLNCRTLSPLPVRGEIIISTLIFLFLTAIVKIYMKEVPNTSASSSSSESQPGLTMAE